MEIAPVDEGDLPDLLALMRGYCNFYGATPSDEALLALARTLRTDPEREGRQLIARDDAGRAVGFATVFWSWSTLSASRLGVMNDLYVVPGARGTGVADELIARCRALAAEHGAGTLAWQTAKDNARAQAVYDRVGGVREEWIDFHLPTTG